MSTVILDDRYQQRHDALMRANELRVYRAAVKRQLAAGGTRLATVLADPECATMRLTEVLLSLPRMGRTKVDRVLIRTGISSTKRIETLTDRQIVALNHALRAYPVVSASCLVA